MPGLTFEKLLLIAIIAVFVLGPEKLPHYAAQLARLVKSLKNMASGAKDRLRDEMGPEFNDVDWQKLDPRQYDPRRIIREALLDDEGAAAPVAVKPPTRSRPVESAAQKRLGLAEAGAAAPFDSEAT
ncbi:Sec-independent protein translocase TatB [Homoserinimonas hongtaonis]|uniref:Sec-independent protein translocase TatB n=1 Tax=Homoserinimonas hongtaonis TaxID=2079791 RepID=A0A2U1SZW0_9MICO|nr:Sec-independent protein translocase TatB [Salinibacterium hongtaonis]AWB89722.1 Sec-independent protein translocase TatB [Salinibacterium hongtaonis]PWB97175.1 Sec-independent protein translocase TatB [Salinibacterium hongtaonis]